MAAYAQFGYGYPSANQLLSGVAQSNAAAVSGIGAPVTTAVTNAPSPLSGANDASLSPSGGSTTTTTGGVTSGPLSPGAISQTSNNAGSGNGTVPTAAAVALGIAEADAAAIGGGGVGSVLGAVGDGGGGGTSCCENGRPIMTDPVSGQTVCSCQYDSARLALSSYSRMPAASVGVYGTPYPSTEQNPYPSIGVDSSAFYSPLSNPYALKEGNTGSDMTAWTSAGLQPTTGYYSYDPALAAYGYGAGYDLASRRKNATRESTATLKAWLNEHKKNPYPTKGEKIMLAIITKMTLTQVSTWFANARRRLKKENKMTWEPKNKTEDDDEAMLSDDEKDKDVSEPEKVGGVYGGIGADPRKDVQSVKTEHGAGKDDKPDDLNGDERKSENLAAMRGLAGPAYNAAYGQHPGYNPYQHQHHPAYYQQHGGYGAQEPSEYSAPKNPLSRGDCGIPIPASKPKIWSLADTVACKTPPPPIAYQQGPAPGQYYHPAPPPPQQQQQMLPSSNMGATQQMQLPQLQPQPHPAHNSSASAMSSYGAASPYSRIPMGYTAGPSNYSNSSSNSNCGSSGSSSSNSGMPTTPTTPATMQAQQLLHQQQQAHHYHQQQQQQQQQRMGFPEIQPDTPPQTPPNMKLASAHSLSTVNPLRAGPALTPTTAMCYTNSAGSHLQPHAAYGGDGACNRFVANLAASRAEA